MKARAMMKNKGSVHSSDPMMSRLCSEPSLHYCFGGILVFTEDYA